MSEFSRFVRQLKRRVRHLNGIRVSAWTLLACGAMGGGASLAVVCLALPDTGWLRWTVPVMSGVAAVVAYAVGWRCRYEMGQLLYSADLKMETGEVLSSLYAVLSKGDGGVVESRLRQEAQSYLNPREGAPASIGPFLIGAAGLLLIAGSVAVSSLTFPVGSTIVFL